MVLVVWVAFGVMAGLLAAKLFHHTAGALVVDLSLGIAGAIAGGLAMNSIGFPPPTAFLVAGMVGAAAGSAAILAGYRAIFLPV